MAKRSKKNQEDVGFNVWSCCGESFSHEEIMRHLEVAHRLERPIEGNRKMIRHIDGRDWFQSYYEWTIGNLVLHQSVRSMRDANDMMRYA